MHTISNTHNLSTLTFTENGIPVATILDNLTDNAIVMEDDKNGIIGFIDGYVFEDRLLYIESLWVRDDYRNRGIGKSLVHKFISAHPTKVVQVSYNEEVAKFYEKLGFYTLENVRIGILTKAVL